MFWKVIFDMLLEGQEGILDQGVETTVNGGWVAAEQVDWPTQAKPRGHGVGEAREDHLRPLARTVGGLLVESH